MPHELTDEQRRALVVGFVQEQFVDQGMIADIALHAPSAKGDQRNHHAHVMLTMRELTGEGFGNKERDWNSPERLEQWREQWALHQNRALERHGHAERVDHRSYEAQGIDREPSQHLGPVANDMERNGKRSRIGDENRIIANDNSDRAKDHRDLAEISAQIMREKSKFGAWADYKRSEIEAAQDLASLDLSQKHARQKSWLDDQIRKDGQTIRATLTAEVRAIDRRLQVAGLRKVLRDIFGRTKTDATTRAQLTATLAGMAKRDEERRQGLERRQASERATEARRQAKNRDRLEKGIGTARERREAEGWTPRTPARGSQRGTQRTGRPDRQRTAKPAPSPTQAREHAPQAATAPRNDSVPSQAKAPPENKPQNKPMDAPTLADLKTQSTSKIDQLREQSPLAKLWQEARRSNDSDRERKPDEGKDGRERSPSPSPDGGKK